MEKYRKLISFLKSIKYHGEVGYWVYWFLFKTRTLMKYKIFSDEYNVKREYKKKIGKVLHLQNPCMLNEKIQWLKLYVRDDFHTICADKYSVRDWIKNEFGEKYLVPLVLHTDNWRDITLSCIPDYPCIIKANHTCGTYHIIRDKNKIDIKKIRTDCRCWLAWNYYATSQEWQYKNIKRKILIEKLLLTNDGHLPNDYKLHYINGVLKFIYVSIDREGCNSRNIYTPDWELLPFSWVSKDTKNVIGEDIPAPATLALMKDFGHRVATKFKYVRVDFYDVDGRLYFGEITLHHGSGYDVFTPSEYDLFYGNQLQL